MAMTFQLKDFDGPLDLLLFLINKEKIDIKDIFVSQITDQYIDSVRNAPDLDMDDATDFLVMALIRRLEEYKRFRETASAMKQFEQAAANLFTKLPEEYPLPPQETELVGLTLQGLTEAFLRIWARKPATDDSPETNHYAPRDIHRDEHNVQECMLTLLKGVSSRGCLRFEETFSAAPSKEEVVTLFLALLELLKLGEIHAEQEGTWGEIVLYPGRGKDVDEYGESATEETE